MKCSFKCLIVGCVALFGSSAVQANENFTKVGDVLRVAAPLGAIYLSYEQHGYAGATACTIAVAENHIATYALKDLISQPRPHGGNDGMPSGHTSAAAVGFGCMLGQEGWTNRTLVFGALTGVTAASRVEADVHTWEQVAAGAALGTFFGWFNTKQFHPDVQFDGYATSKQVGMSISFTTDTESPALFDQMTNKSRAELLTFANSSY